MKLIVSVLIWRVCGFKLSKVLLLSGGMGWGKWREMDLCTLALLRHQNQGFGLATLEN